MATNKVTINTPEGEEVLIDLTGDNPTPETVADGVVFHGADGEQRVGTAMGGIPVPETAAVGQTVAVRAVDADGKPTEWEAVELPESGIPVPELSGPNEVVAVQEVDENWKPTSWHTILPVQRVNGKWPNEYGEVFIPTGGGGVQPQTLQDYVPKHYLKTMGMLSTQNESALPDIGDAEWTAIGYGDGATVMVADGTNIAARKVDGGQWEAVTLPYNSTWHAVAYSKEHGWHIAISYDHWAISYDRGATWVDAEDEGCYPPAYVEWIDISTDEQCILMTTSGFFPAVWYLDGYGQWVPSQVLGPVPTAYDGTKFVQSYGTFVRIVTDVTAWEVQDIELPEGVDLWDIAYTDGLFMGYGETGGIYYSPDGLNWTEHEDFVNGLVYPNGLVTQGGIQSIAACNGRFLFYVPDTSTVCTYILSIPANNPAGWDHLVIGYGSSVKLMKAVGQRFALLVKANDEEFMGAAPVIMYSDDGLLLSTTIPKITPPVLTINGQKPDENGNVVVEGGGGGSYSDWSEADKAAVLADVIAALPVYNGEVEDV